MLEPLWLTVQLAAATTFVLFLLGTPLAYWLSATRGPWRPLVEAVTALPLVLPPTVLGFYLLLILNPSAPMGSLWVSLTGETLTFSFSGLVVASVVYSLPFMIQPLQSAFEGVSPDVKEAAAACGAGPLDRFFTIIAPLCARGFLTAGVLTFAHTVGEFGVILMVGGAIPGETKVISIAIYEHVEALRYGEAHRLSAILLVFSVAVLTLTYALNGKARLRAG
jgi:molybdate transport system permease protein